jgi:predicted nuclease with RNAse H fold
VSVLGIDLAAGARRTYACVLDGTRARLHERCDDDTLLELAAGREKVGIDAPFGWPRAFVEALIAHRGHEAWPAPDGEPEKYRAELSYRETDRAVMPTRRPLSVSTDRIGVTAMRCAHLLHRWKIAGEAVDRSGRGKFVEVYPAGALEVWGLGASGYKGKSTEALAAKLDRLLDAVPLELSDRELCARVHDAFDALIAALIARAAALDLTDGPPPEHAELAAEEGWIHLPRPGTLARLNGG